MNAKDEIKLLLLLFMGLKYLGIILIVIGLIILIVFIIKKKKVTAPLIVCALGVIAAVFSNYKLDETLTDYIEVIKQLGDETALEIAQYAKHDSDGNVYYEICSFSLTDNHGNAFTNDTLKDYKYTIVNIWEPWCTFCKQEMPDLEKIYEEYKDKGINMVGFYNEEEDAQSVIDEYGLTYPVVHLDEEQYKEILGQFKMAGIPVTFVLDSNGRPVDLNLSDEEFQQYADYEPEISEMYRCLVSGKRDYDYWKEKTDALLAAG